ncbi:MAG TPA: alpha/beta fold hydrolase [Methylobacterium sp.]
MNGITTRSIAANGLRFAIDEAGSGEAVALCLHGFPEARISWRHQLPYLAAQGWHAVAPDLRGYGDTSRPRERRAYRLEHLVADAGALFDALGARRRLLVAHDWGGLIAWTFAMQRARPLDGLVILNVPHPAVFRSVLGRSWRQRARSWYVGAFQIPLLPEALLTAGRAAGLARAFTATAAVPGAFPPAVLERYRANATQPGAMRAMIDYYRANLGTLMREAPSPMIDVPTLMIWGEQDTALGLELTEGYGPYLRDFTLRRLPQAAHWVQQEAPDAVNAAIGNWLASRALG